MGLGCFSNFLYFRRAKAARVRNCECVYSHGMERDESGTTTTAAIVHSDADGRNDIRNRARR